MPQRVNVAELQRAGIPVRPLVSTSKVRSWARDKGIQLGDRGRIPNEVLKAYHEDVAARRRMR